MKELSHKVEGQRSPRWAFMKTFAIKDRRGKLYLKRWRIIQTPWASIMLHKIVGPDPDPALHDHPWNFISIVLRGGYRERVRVYRGRGSGYSFSRYRTHKRGSVHKLGSQDLHQINRLVANPTWTLVLTGRRTRNWGFWVKGSWVPWAEYEGQPDTRQAG